MASEDDLAKVMQNALERSGDLALLRVQLEDKLALLSPQPPSFLKRTGSSIEIEKTEMPNEVYLANELIREYFKLTGCDKTASVFVAESGLPAKPISGVQLRKALALGKELSREGPLLGIMVDHLK